MSAISGTQKSYGADRSALVEERVNARLAQAFDAEERAGHSLAVKGRTVALLVIAALLAALNPFPDVLYYHGLIVLFVLIGYAGLAVERAPWYRPWQSYALIAVDFALLTFTLIYPNPIAGQDYPPQVTLKFGNFIYFFVMLVGYAFSYRPGLVVWAGAAGATCWAVGVAWLASLPDSIIEIPETASVGEVLELRGLPTFIDIHVRVQEVVVFLIVASLLASIVQRSRQLVQRQASLERERSNLARYFSPSTIDLLAQRDDPLSEVREHEAAVLFADIVGFTSWAEQHEPRAVIALLREVHGRMEEIVFAHGGTLDKFIGDGLMATFGTPDPGARDATNAIGCFQAIGASFADWNEARGARGLPPVKISLGLHYGPVVVGDIGSERRLEFAVLGDTVNVASRLEGLTRELGCCGLVSDEVVQAVRREAAEDARVPLAGLQRHGELTVKGRRLPVTAWALAGPN